MATEETQVLDEREEVIKAARRQLTALKQAVANFESTIKLLAGEKATVSKIDENDEPTFVYEVKVKIPKDIYLTKKMKAYAVKYGFNEFDTQKMWQDFLSHYMKSAKKWAHWSRVWFDWVRRQHEAKAKGGGLGPATRFDSYRTRG